jgi:ABC-type Fe3+ transport system permease subunit
MRKHLWWVTCLIGVGIMAAAILIPVNCWNAAWWRQLEADWHQFATRQGWDAGFRDGAMLAGLAAGATVVVVGLAVSLIGRRDQPATPPEPQVGIV